MNDKVETTYTVPQNGYYQVSDQVWVTRPTENFKEIPNPDKFFWEWWKPSIILQREYVTVTEQSGSKICRFKKGDQIQTKFLNRL